MKMDPQIDQWEQTRQDEARDDATRRDYEERETKTRRNKDKTAEGKARHYKTGLRSSHKTHTRTQRGEKEIPVKGTSQRMHSVAFSIYGKDIPEVKTTVEGAFHNLLK